MRFTKKERELEKKLLLLLRPTLKQSMKNLCGEFLGSGLNRDVYVCKVDPNYVVKIEGRNGYGAFANATEWRHYCDNAEWKFLEQWLAPCLFINETGNILIQRRVDQSRPRKDYPKYIPALFTDLKLTNFGWIGDRFVCCDYSFFLIHTNGKKMKYAKWTGLLKKNKDANN